MVDLGADIVEDPCQVSSNISR